MNRIIILIFLLLNSVNSFSKVVGTKTHDEVEFRRAYNLPKDFTSKDIRGIESQLKKLLSKTEFKLEKKLGEKYYLNKKFKSFLFKDYYYDTDNYDILKNNASYRLRYRWSTASDYYKYELMPLKSYYPSRCEIQFKYGYEFNEGISSMKEVRFEFRDESEPFNRNKDAPPPPWLFDEYKKYMNTGKFRNYKILPKYILHKKINIGKKKLKNKVITETIRIRNHLNIKNDFGDNPNPEQIVIITFDLVYANNGVSFLEFELELDRSVGKNLNKILNDKKRDSEVKSIANDLKNDIFKDIIFLRDNITLYLEKNHNLRRKSLKSKYKRVIKKGYSWGNKK